MYRKYLLLDILSSTSHAIDLIPDLYSHKINVSSPFYLIAHIMIIIDLVHIRDLQFYYLSASRSIQQPFHPVWSTHFC